MSNKVYLTKEWLQKLQEELSFLQNTKRVEIAEKLKEAISFWDLSENSEYEDARNEQAQVELRIAEITEQLKNYELIDKDSEKVKNKNTVNIWSIVEVKNIDEKEIETYKIVGSTEADILSKLPTISNESPVWSSLLGKKQWDIVSVKAPSWTYKFEIISIK